MVILDLRLSASATHKSSWILLPSSSLTLRRMTTLHRRCSLRFPALSRYSNTFLLESIHFFCEGIPEIVETYRILIFSKDSAHSGYGTSQLISTDNQAGIPYLRVSPRKTDKRSPGSSKSSRNMITRYRIRPMNETLIPLTTQRKRSS